MAEGCPRVTDAPLGGAVTVIDGVPALPVAIVTEPSRASDTPGQLAEIAFIHSFVAGGMFPRKQPTGASVRCDTADEG